MDNQTIDKGIEMLRSGRVKPDSAIGKDIINSAVRRDPHRAVTELAGLKTPELATALTAAGHTKASLMRKFERNDKNAAGTKAKAAQELLMVAAFISALDGIFPESKIEAPSDLPSPMGEPTAMPADPRPHWA